ncbi:hypothetical protein [Alkalicoccobacillus porphyridii]|uniref:Type II secretion system protein n=1 Tax=Alkalicoccobacillus porphyridii TaxID=2597270 RepID=A0A553ZTB9_9BACI|nr:hypothetical protein [Alkalicoccobacillus porphyridii]TSB44724.1 hypothetical protein FN960_20015 [Alkalicoccobacillus porphyridii]
MEVMFSFALISMSALFILPIFSGIHQERVAVRQHEEALLLLETQVLHYLHGRQGEEPKNTLYTFETIELKDGTMRFCLSWKGANQRDQQTCLYAKK